MINPIGVQIMNLQKQIDEAKAKEVVKVEAKGVKKNQKPGVADPNRRYVLLSKKLSDWGKVPQQQRDVAAILSKNFEVGKEVSEQEVFGALVRDAVGYDSLSRSKQDPTYLFKWYRGLRNDGRHAGYVARNFVRVIG